MQLQRSAWALRPLTGWMTAEVPGRLRPRLPHLWPQLDQRLLTEPLPASQMGTTLAFWLLSFSVIYGYAVLREAGLLWAPEAFLLPSLMAVAALLFPVQQPAGHLPAICARPTHSDTRDVRGSVWRWFRHTAPSSAQCRTEPR